MDTSDTCDKSTRPTKTLHYDIPYTTLVPVNDHLLAMVVSATVSDGGIHLISAKEIEDKKKVIVVKDPSGTYQPGTWIYPQGGATAPSEKKIDFIWVKLTDIYGYRE